MAKQSWINRLMSVFFTGVFSNAGIILIGLLSLITFGLYTESRNTDFILLFLGICSFIIIAYYSKSRKIKRLFAILSILLLFLSPYWFHLEMESFEEVYFLLPIVYVLIFPAKYSVAGVALVIISMYFLHPGDEPISALVEDSFEVIIITFFSIVISDQYFKLQDKIKLLNYENRHDKNTTLQNKNAFNQEIERISISTSYSVLIVGIKGQRMMNNYYGYENGNKILAEFATILNSTLSTAHSIYHIENDEYAIIINGNDKLPIENIASHLRHFTSSPITINDQSYSIELNFGCAFFPTNTTDFKSIYAYAYYALQASTDNAVNYYTPALSKAIEDRYELISEIKLAILNDNFEPYFQPKLDVLTGKVLGAEALIRWHHKEKGLISPATFIPICEESGLINEIGKIMLNKSCAILSEIISLGFDTFSVSVNISANQLASKNFYIEVKEILDYYKVPPYLLEIEITEGALVNNLESAIMQIKALKEMGVSISIDDFGVEYSSFAYLRNLPIDTLKLDRLFVKDLEQNVADQKIVKAMIDVSHSLNLVVLAEGVETKEQLEILVQNACDQFQGYLVSKPVPYDIFKSTFLNNLSK